MRKFIALLGVAAVLAGLRLFDNGALSFGEKGRLTVYGRGGTEAVFTADDLPLLYRENGYSRLDTDGGLDSAYDALKRVDAQIVRTEYVDGLTIIYAYSPYINVFVNLSGDRINIMAAVRGSGVAYGVPMLKGSY